MSVTIPTSYQNDVNIPSMGSNELILLDDWKAMTHELNFMWSRTGFKCSAPFRETPWQTTSTTYTATDGATNGKDLDTWMGFGLLLRPVEVSQLLFASLELVTYGRNLDVQCQAYRFDETNGNMATLSGLVATTSHDNDSEWQTGSDLDGRVNAYQNASTANPLGLLGFEVKAKVPATGTGYLWTFGVRAIIATSAYAITQHY